AGGKSALDAHWMGAIGSGQGISASSDNGYGVVATSYSGTGVSASSRDGDGLHATGGSGGYGINASATAGDKSAVYAHWDGSTGTGAGIFATSSKGDVVHAVGSGQGYSALYGSSPNTGYAGWFDGKVQLNGNLNVTGTITA